MKTAALINELRLQTEGLSGETLAAWACDRFAGRIAVASSLGVEDQVLTDMVARAECLPPIFTLDTGRLFPETYELIGTTETRYGLRLKILFPDSGAVEEMTSRYGANLFRSSVELRKLCCQVRKVEPLSRALAGLDAWMTGVRRAQSVTRQRAEAIEWDEANGLVKINPLIDWDEKAVWEYVRRRNVPYNPLHDQGFPSIGCSSCTRAVKRGEDLRSGRWWWEKPEHRECGLHTINRGSQSQGGNDRALNA